MQENQIVGNNDTPDRKKKRILIGFIVIIIAIFMIGFFTIGNIVVSNLRLQEELNTCLAAGKSLDQCECNCLEINPIFILIIFLGIEAVVIYLFIRIKNKA